MYALSIAEHLPEDHPLRYTGVEQVPEELALALPLCMDVELFHDAYSAGWNQWNPQMTLAQLDAQHSYFLRDRPARAESTPGRNEPCPCGSNKKYKRCCGA